MRGIVDRIEGATLILEVEGEFIDIPVSRFPEDISEGDIVSYEDGYIVLEEETADRKIEMENLLGNLFDKNEDDIGE